MNRRAEGPVLPPPVDIAEKLRERELRRLDRQLRCIVEAVLAVNPHLDREGVLHVLWGIALDVQAGRVGRLDPEGA